MSERYGRASEGNTSWTSVLIGWLAALGASLIFSAVVSSVVGAMFGGGGSAQNMGTAGFVGLLITLFLAFLIGGYTAGRMASRSGTKHGLWVPSSRCSSRCFWPPWAARWDSPSWIICKA